MNHASAGNAPALPAHPHAYFRTPEFHARMRNLNDAMRDGMMPKQADMESYLGCGWDEFIAYATSSTDAHGITWIDIGDGECITMEMGLTPLAPELSPEAAIARGAGRDQALAVIIPRLRYLRSISREHYVRGAKMLANGTLETQMEDRTQIRDLLCSFTDHPEGTFFRIENGGGNKPIMTGYYDCRGQTALTHGTVHIISWRRGWEDRLF